MSYLLSYGRPRRHSVGIHADPKSHGAFGPCDARRLEKMYHFWILKVVV